MVEGVLRAGTERPSRWFGVTASVLSFVAGVGTYTRTDEPSVESINVPKTNS